MFEGGVARSSCVSRVVRFSFPALVCFRSGRGGSVLCAFITELATSPLKPLSANVFCYSLRITDGDSAQTPHDEGVFWSRAQCRNTQQDVSMSVKFSTETDITDLKNERSWADNLPRSRVLVEIPNYAHAPIAPPANDTMYSSSMTWFDFRRVHPNTMY